MENLIIAIPVLFIVVLVIVLIGSAWNNPALKHKRRMEKLVKNLGNAPDFMEAMRKQGRVSQKEVRQRAELVVVKHVGLDEAGYPHRCAYCDNPLYINQKNCSGCGAPRE